MTVSVFAFILWVTKSITAILHKGMHVYLCLC